MSLDGSPRRVLVVDDDFVTLHLADRILRQAGFLVETVAEGRAALDRLAAGCADLVVTDIFMPEVDGLEIVMAARLRCPGTPVLVISGGSHVVNDDYLAIARRLGADATLDKPLQADRFLALVEDLLAPCREDVVA